MINKKLTFKQKALRVILATAGVVAPYVGGCSTYSNNNPIKSGESIDGWAVYGSKPEESIDGWAVYGSKSGNSRIIHDKNKKSSDLDSATGAAIGGALDAMGRSNVGNITRALSNLP